MGSAAFARRPAPFLTLTLLLAAVACGFPRAESHEEGRPPAPPPEEKPAVEERAENFLDLRRLSPEDPERGPQLARQLEAVLGLPFPDHPDSARREIRDTLEWPPRGSPGAKG